MTRAKTYTTRRWIASVAETVLRVVLPNPGFSYTDDSRDRAALRGIKSVDVQVPPMDESVERDGFSQIQIEADVKLRLWQAGINVTSSSQDSSGRLFVLINAVKSDALPLYAVSCDLEFRQPVSLRRDPCVLTSAATWSRSMVQLVSSARIKEFTRQSIGNLVDQFISAYRKQNPRQ